MYGVGRFCWCPSAIIEAAAAEADVIVWDGGNNDMPFLRPDLMFTLVDPLRPGDERGYHPGEAVLGMADVIVVGKTNAAPEGASGAVGFAAFSPRFGRPRAANPCTPFGVGYVLRVRFEKSCEAWKIERRSAYANPDPRQICKPFVSPP